MAPKTLTPTRIPRGPVRSGTIGTVGYDTTSHTLAIEFQSGHLYYFAGVAPDVAADFLKAESIGKTFSQEIRGRYQSEKMTGRCASCGDIGWLGDTCSDCGTAGYAPERKPKADA